MTKQFRFQALLMTAAAIAMLIMGTLSQANSSQKKDHDNNAIPQDRLSEEVRQKLVLLPFYTLFDNLAFKVNGSEVTLLGQVTQPVVKLDAENAVKHIEGVTKVDNQIQVLPLSKMDDQIRRAQYRAIYGEPSLQKYEIGAVPPIHIIVSGGHVTLEGYVNNQMDKDVAGIRAKGVSNVFSVTNNLQVIPGR